jgi:hypothetical protein
MPEPTPGDRDGSMIGELLGVVPRFLDRTQRQAAFSARTISHLPCLGRWLRPPRQDPDVPAHEAPQPADVLSVLATDPPEPPAAVVPAAAASGAAQAETSLAGEPVPEVDSLPIPGYESLAASQVIPRLAALTTEELRSVGAYERATRHRQTILHRVAQLLAE